MPLLPEKNTLEAPPPSQWPLEGRITGLFGKRLSPRSGRPENHKGLDIAAPAGTPILAAGDGLATFVGFQKGYGRALIIDHGNGFSTLYAHASKIFIKSGEVAKRGQVIAAVGRSGAATGPHLHYEIREDGVAGDPLKVLGLGLLAQVPKASL